MEAQQEKARHLAPFIPPGRIASIILRYSNYQEFYETAKLLQISINSAMASSLPAESSSGGKTIYYTPIGSGPNTVEIRLVYFDSVVAGSNGRNRKRRLSTYYEVPVPSNTAAAKALKDAVGDVIKQFKTQSINLSELEGEETSNLFGKSSNRVILSSSDDSTQVCLLVNPPFPRTGSNEFLRKLPTLLAIAVGIGASLLGIRSLLRQR